MKLVVLVFLGLCSTPLAAKPMNQLPADQRDIPPELFKGATYTVTLKNGEVWEGTAEDLKLVYRVKKPKVKTMSTIKAVPHTVFKTVDKFVYPKFQISAYIGSGPGSLRVKDDGGVEASIEARKGPVFGLGIAMNVNEDWGLKGLLLTNETVLFGAHLNLFGD